MYGGCLNSMSVDVFWGYTVDVHVGHTSSWEVRPEQSPKRGGGEWEHLGNITGGTLEQT